MIFQSQLNRADDPIDIIHHSIIPKANYSVALGFEIFGSFAIVFFLLQALTAIQFNNEFLLDTAEIGNIFSDGVLSSEIHPKLVFAKICPKFCLRRRRFLAEFASMLITCWSCSFCWHGRDSTSYQRMIARGRKSNLGWGRLSLRQGKMGTNHLTAGGATCWV